MPRSPFNFLPTPSLIALVTLLVCTRAQPQPVGEYELKAALLLNIARFVQWPENAFSKPAEDVVFCVVGRDPFAASIDAIAGRSLHSRRVTIARFHSAETAAEAVCHLAFITEPTSDELNLFARNPVLTIGESRDFARIGGVIGLRTTEGKVRFDVNVAASKAQGLEISAQLLQLATIVDGKTGNR